MCGETIDHSHQEDNLGDEKVVKIKTTKEIITTEVVENPEHSI